MEAHGGTGRQLVCEDQSDSLGRLTNLVQLVVGEMLTECEGWWEPDRHWAAIMLSVTVAGEAEPYIAMKVISNTICARKLNRRKAVELSAGLVREADQVPAGCFTQSTRTGYWVG